MIPPKYGGIGSNGFDTKWIFGTHCNWKKRKSWEPFWSCQLNTTANSAHLAHFGGVAGSSKTAGRILIFSIAMVADYSFELISIAHWVPQFFMHNKSILNGVNQWKCNSDTYNQNICSNGSFFMFNKRMSFVGMLNHIWLILNDKLNL